MLLIAFPSSRFAAMNASDEDNDVDLASSVRRATGKGTRWQRRCDSRNPREFPAFRPEHFAVG